MRFFSLVTAFNERIFYLLLPNPGPEPIIFLMFYIGWGWLTTSGYVRHVGTLSADAYDILAFYLHVMAQHPLISHGYSVPRKHQGLHDRPAWHVGTQLHTAERPGAYDSSRRYSRRHA